MLNLHPWQSRAVDSVLAALDARPILVAPTGSGKTVMAVEIVRRLGRPTLWLAHRQELIDQAAAHLEAAGGMVGIIKAGYAPAPLANIQVASVQTLHRRGAALPGLDPEAPDAGLIVIDEAHHATADTYRDILAGYPGVPVLGLTATPFRLDGAGLGDLFGRLIVAASTADLCHDGYLHAPRVWAAGAPDLRDVKVTAGDYNLGALARRTNTPELVGDVVATWQKRATGRRTVAFAVDIEHSQAVAAAFRAASIPAEHLDGSTSRSDRDAVLSRLRSGETLVVSNCMVLTEGWDLPALECAIIARPTASLCLHLQMVGRIMRAAEGKAGAIVLDHAGNHHVHGLATRRLDYTLDAGGKVGSSEPLGLRRCRACGLFFDPSQYACPECGWRPLPTDTALAQVPGELVEFDDSVYDYRRETWNALEAERQAAGYKPGWSAFQFKERFGTWPVIVGGDLVDTANATQEQKRAVYEQLCAVAQTRGFKPGWASYRYKDTFGAWPRGFVAQVRIEAIQARIAGQTIPEEETACPF